MDQFGFEIKDIEYMIVFDKHTGFNNFVTEYMDRRINATLEGNKGLDQFCKIALNGSYGYDIMNEANFTDVKLCSKNETINAHLQDRFRSDRKLDEDFYQVNLAKKQIKCSTSLQQGLFTLDNAKFWYLNFIYNFLFKAFDTEKMHFCEGDTDSMYFAFSEVIANS